MTGLGLLLGRLLDDQGLGRQEQGGDGGRVLQGGAGDLDRVDDAGLDQVAVLAGGRVEALALVELRHLGGDDVALKAGVLGDPAQRLDGGAADDRDTGGLVAGTAEVVVQDLDGVDQRGATTGDDALLDRGAGRGDGVLQTVLALLQLDLGGRADADHADAAGQLGEALLELLAVPVRVGRLDLGLDLGDAPLDVLGVAAAVHDGRVVLGDGDAAGGAQHVQTGLVELEADLLGDDGGTGEGGHVAEHRLAAVTEAGRLDGDGVERAADLVDHQGRQGLALDVLGDDQQRLGATRLDDLLQQRQQVLDRTDLALVDQDVRVVEDGLHTLLVGHHVRGQVALVEGHALGEVQVDTEGVGLLDGDDAVLADLVHRLGDELADLLVLRGERGDSGDVGLVVDRARGVEQLGGDGGDGGVDALLQGGRGGAGGDVAQALADQRLGQHGRGGGAVTRDVVGLGRHLLDELGAEVLVRVVALDLTGDGDAVVGDGRGAELLVDDDVAALGADGHLDGVGQLVHAALKGATGVLVELQNLRHGSFSNPLGAACRRALEMKRAPRHPANTRGGQGRASGKRWSLPSGLTTGRLRPATSR
ncbi:DNA polymerase II large subunit [Streptomyces sp. GBA 94-10 4N24]|nr:DNA polymerase II large subunit [Streptomyces sp. GBA 94-10 4N24]UZN60879.1 DNA polymerase II large subunit [Streptomyces sp. GBA 94-10 4N24]